MNIYGLISVRERQKVDIKYVVTGSNGWITSISFGIDDKRAEEIMSSEVFQAKMSEVLNSSVSSYIKDRQ